MKLNKLKNKVMRLSEIVEWLPKESDLEVEVDLEKIDRIIGTFELYITEIGSQKWEMRLNRADLVKAIGQNMDGIIKVKKQ